MDTQKTPESERTEQAKTVQEKVFERFLGELSQQEEMEEVSERLRSVLFSGEAVNEKVLRAALFNDNEQ